MFTYDKAFLTTANANMSQFPKLEVFAMSGIVSTPKLPNTDITMADICRLPFIPTSTQPFNYDSLVLNFVTYMRPLFATPTSAALAVPSKNTEIAAKRALIATRTKLMGKSLLALCGVSVVFYFLFEYP